MAIIIIVCWTIWKTMNDLIFLETNPAIHNSKAYFKSEFDLLLLRTKRSYSPRINQWIASLKLDPAFSFSHLLYLFLGLLSFFPFPFST